MSDKLKAYIVTDHGEGTGGVVFARFHAEARRNGAGEYGDGDWESVECRRATEFDQYAPGPVRPMVLIEHGWWFECTSCGHHIDEDTSQRAVERNQSLYCSPWCRLNAVEDRGRRRAEEKLGARLASLYLAPFCTVVQGAVFSDYDPETRRRRKILGAYFTFPGAKHGKGSWRADRRDMAMISQGDYETYQQLKQEYQQHDRD